ncbi:hypothetical protein M758_8G071300 [Ceratodon purpureus]|nr:hypothetical protein M758_8G071300 [Ceratodon purpureus]
MEEEDVVAGEEAEEGEEEDVEFENGGGEGEEEEVAEPLAEAPVAPMKKAKPVGSKKRKIVHRTRTGRRKDAETKTVPLRKMKATVSMDLSDPSQLTMKEIIRRAEAIERAKAREEAAKKAEEKEKRGSASRTAAREQPAAQNTPAPAVLTPQVQIVNGRIVINQQSLVVGAQASTREDTETYRRVEEDRPKLNYNSYSNRTPVERWKAEDTDLFYKALQQFGTDFELIQNLFPGRTRRQVKAKFKNEEKLNPVRLADALGHKTQDQSHHYRAIIEMLKTEKENEVDSEEQMLENLLNPVVREEEETVIIEAPASTSADKPDNDDNAEPPVNPVVLDKVKPDERPSEPASAIPPESEVAASAVKDDPPASEAPDDPVPSQLSKNNPPVNPLGSYGKQTFSGNPLGSYGKEPAISGNPLGSYGKNPLGMYK